MRSKQKWFVSFMYAETEGQEKMRAYWKILNPFYLLARHREMQVQHFRHNLVKQHIQNGKSILDVGGSQRANIGRYMPNYTVTVNVNPELKPNLVWNGCDLPFKDKSFPNVVSIGTIHLIHDTARFVAELKRVASERVIIYDGDYPPKPLEVIDIG